MADEASLFFGEKSKLQPMGVFGLYFQTTILSFGVFGICVSVG